MFEYPVNEISDSMNSQMNIREMRKGKNSIKGNMINCPTILAGMSHEMRTHMNAIVAFSFFMKENCCNDSDREEYSNQIRFSCEQLLGIFDSFFDSAIIDSGSSKIDLKICKLENLLDDLISEFRENLKKEGHNDLELITEVQFSNSIAISIDKSRFFRVIRSLFQNSIINTKAGYIKIGYYFRDDKVTVYVLDSGQGYFKSNEFLHTEDINESLSLYNDTHTAINITLAKKLIQMLGGTIWIECNGLTGTGIYFSVPAKRIVSSDVNVNKYVNSLIRI